jgi:hypothetical protein
MDDEDNLNQNENKLDEKNFRTIEDDHITSVSTAPTQANNQNLTSGKGQANQYELFEKFLSFVDTTDELNPVLSGYFCKLF